MYLRVRYSDPKRKNNKKKLILYIKNIQGGGNFDIMITIFHCSEESIINVS